MGRRTIVAAIALSAALHLGALVLLTMAPAWPFPARATPPERVAWHVDAQGSDDDDARVVVATEVEVRSAGDRDELAASPSAPTSAPNADARAAVPAASGGHGVGAPTRVTDRADEVTLATQPYDVASGYRVQRIRTGDERQSREQVRATPHPAASPWLATRDGHGHARRAPTSPSDGDATNAAPTDVERVAQAARPVDEAGGRKRLPALELSSAAPPSPREAEGTARPWLPRDPAATDTAKPSEEVSDRVDAPLVSDVRAPDPIEMTRPASPGASQSSAGDGAAGFAPQARGTAPVPAGTPGLPRGELRPSTYQRQYDLYLSRLKQKVDPLWEFPRDLALQLEQADLLVSFTIERDGRLKDLKLVKRSGFASFDKNVLKAIKKAAPFDPLPPSLGTELRVTAPFAGGSPAIR